MIIHYLSVGNTVHIRKTSQQRF